MFEFGGISPRVKRLVEKREYTNDGHMFLNTERTKLYTEYYKANEAEYPILKRAGALKNWCENCTTLVNDEDILVGGLAPTFRGMNFYVEWESSWLYRGMNDSDENFKAAWQAPGAVYLSDGDREYLKDAVDFWLKNNIPAHISGLVQDEFWEISGNGANNFPQRGMGLAYGFKPQGHYVAGFGKAVNTGFGAVREQAQAKLAGLKGRTFGSDAKRQTFYRAVVKVCDGACKLAKRYAAACREKAETAGPERKAELLKMADSLDYIMENPARTYWEGLQVMLLYQIMLCTDAQQHGESFGGIDRYVGHLLEKELGEGTITTDVAQEYTDAFILRVNDLICLDMGYPNELIIKQNESGKSLYHLLGQYQTATDGIHITVGGQNADGSDSTNTCTYLALKTYGRLCLPDPTIAIRIHQNTPEDIWTLAIEASKRAGGMPQFQNDDIIIPLLQRRGLSLEDARGYSIVGCVEPAGSGNEWPACGGDGAQSIWSLVGCLTHAINGGVHPKTGATGVPCKKLYEYESFEEFQAAFEAQLKYFLDWQISYCNFYELAYSEFFPCISASVMMEGCMESGVDAAAGGCKYNSAAFTCIGTANVGDGLMAIKKLCFDDKRYTLREMYDALSNNWEGYEELRSVIINEVPHYGNDNAEVDELAAWGLGLFAEYISQLEGPRGKYCGGTFTMTAHIHVGMATPATPDGRADGDPLADAISPRQGFDLNGPTAYLSSAARLPHERLANGDQLNIRFSPSSVQGDDGTKKLRNLIRTYFDMSGMQVQFNVIGTSQLHEAQEKPEEFKSMVVRIAGFSAYFVELQKDVQNDFITRTEQSM